MFAFPDSLCLQHPSLTTSLPSFASTSLVWNQMGRLELLLTVRHRKSQTSPIRYQAHVLNVLSQHISENLTRVYAIPIHCRMRIHVWTLLRAKKTPLTGFRPPSELPAPAMANSPTNLSPPLENPAAAPVEDVVKGMLVEKSVEREPK